MSSEANVQLLKEAYRRWNDSKGASVDYWFDSVIGPQISFGSVPRGAQPLAFATDYNDRAKLRGYFDGLLAEWTMHGGIHSARRRRGRAWLHGLDLQEDRQDC